MNMNIPSVTIPLLRPGRGIAVALALLLGACGGGEGQDPDPLVQDFGMAYVRRPLALNGTGGAVQPDIRRLESFTPGGNLYYRDLASPSAPERNVTAATIGDLGDVKDVEASYDGTALLFAMHLPDDPNAAIPPTWNIWEYDIASDTLTRVIADDATADEADDVAPHYLPDGRIIFSSSRQRQFRENLLNENITWPVPRADFRAEDESRAEHAMLLHVMEVTRDSNDRINGVVDIRQVSMNQSHDLDPMVRASGEVVFSRWDNMGSRHAISLYQMHPDGSELQLLYGAHSHATGTGGATVQFLQPREMPDGRLLTVQLPFTGTFRGGDLLLIDTQNYIDNTYPTVSNLGVLFGPAQQPATQNSVTTDGSISPGGRFMAAWPLDDGTNRLLVSWSACRVMLNNIIQPCTPANVADPNAVEADPIYGIFLYDMDTNTQLPLVVPEEGVLFTDVVAAAPRILPGVIFDKERAIELEPQAFDEGVGYLDIRSVYDVDGLDTTPAGIAALADPAQTPPDTLPARFLRIVKAVGIPDNMVKQVPGTAFGASSSQLMREIIGYVPVQPDGSVRVKVPANVPLAISVVDGDGRRIGARHQNWLQLRPGETVSCNGCHVHSSGTPHGHPEGPVSVWAGSPTTGPAFPNTNTMFSPEFTETMAQTLTRHDGNFLWPTVDVLYSDVWTDPMNMALTPGTDIAYRYADLSTPAPATAACQADWDTLCRTVINYEQHIHPLWSVNRGANTCTNCHNVVDGGGAVMVPAAQLDLSDGYDPQVSAHLKSYRELLFQDFEQVISGTSLVDRTDPGPVDPVTGMPTVIRYPVQASMSTAGASASNTFFSRFDSGASHDGYLTAAELRLLAEWLDIGAQYFNDPFAVP